MGLLTKSATGIGNTFTSLTDAMGMAVQGAGSVLKFGFRHPIMTGILGVIAAKGISAGMNAKNGETFGVAAANGIGGMFSTIKSYAGALLGHSTETAKAFSETLTKGAEDFNKTEIAQTGEKFVEAGKEAVSKASEKVEEMFESKNSGPEVG